MITLLIPDHQSEAQVEEVLDQHWQRGHTYPKGALEDYTRIWFGDQERVRYRAVGLYSTAMLQLDEKTSHFSELKTKLNLLGVEQVLDAAERAVGRERIRAVMQLGCMVAAVEMTPELDARLGAFWNRLLGSDEQLIVSLALNIAYPVSASLAVRQAVRSVRDSIWVQNVVELEAHWAKSTEPEQISGSTDAHMNCECEH